MRIHVQLFDDNHQLLGEADADMSSPLKATASRVRRVQLSSKQDPKCGIDLSLPERAFFKKYSPSLSGPKQFVLLLAYLAKGKVGNEVPLSEIKSRWGKMTSILDCDFNPSFTNTAKEKGWVDVKKTGIYVLHSSWQGILG
jgi:hypothetical protein